MLWVIFAGLTGFALLSVLWPLMRTPRGLSHGATEVALYKAQIAEIDRDAASGLIAPEDARNAKAEAARRLMAMAKDPSKPSRTGSGRAVRFVSIAVLIFIPALALGLYAMIGEPNRPDLPLSARREASPVQVSPANMELMAAVERIEAHLSQHPDDGRGYEVLAPVYLRLGRADAAVQAYAEALRLLGKTPERFALYGEALTFAANGVVTEEARKAFEAAAKDASLAKPRFFLGLAAAQDGDQSRARDIWERLLAETSGNPPWAQALRERMAAAPTALQDGPAAISGPAPKGAMAAKIQAMSEADRSGAIRGMVDNLATRLAQNGQDLEGWLRLMRAYAVLREPDKARSALADAKRNLAGDPPAIARIDALARELGLEG